MRIISWNVNGLQGLLKKGEDSISTTSRPQEKNALRKLLDSEEPDILCLQEIRCSAKFDPAPFLREFPYISANHSTVGRGYSGTLIASKHRPLQTFINFPTELIKGIDSTLSKEDDIKGTSTINQEGRVITQEYKDFWLVNVYAPNSKPTLARLPERITYWEALLFKHLQSLEGKPVVLIGDLNVIPTAQDQYAPAFKAGAAKEEKEAFQLLLDKCQLSDTFRSKHPHSRKWSWKPSWKSSNGCRLDFGLVSQSLLSRVTTADILSYYGSDHLPIVLEWKDAT